MNKLLKLLATLSSVALISGTGAKVADAAMMTGHLQNDSVSPLFKNVAATSSTMSQEILSAYTAAAKNSGTDMSVVWERLLTQFQSRGATMADFAGAVASTDLAGPDLLAALQEIADRFGSTIPDVAPEVVSQAFMDGGRQYADSVQQRIEDAMGRTIQLAREEGDETNNAYTG